MDIEEIEKDIEHLLEIRDQFKDVAEEIEKEGEELSSHEDFIKEHIAGEELQSASEDFKNGIEKIHRALRRLEIEREERLGEFSWEDILQR